MEIFDSIFLGVIQGITEFLPISSSGHLIIAEHYMDLPVSELKGFDIAVHAGTLAAIFAYFRKDFWRLIKSLFNKEDKKSHYLIIFLLTGTIPAVIAGLFLGDYLDLHFRNSFSVSIMLITIGIFFFIAEYISKKIKNRQLDLPRSIIIGLAQALALIPGVSRSGATISAGLSTGLKREESARFSFLLGSIAITAATAYSILKIFQGDFSLPPNSVLIGGLISSFISGLAAVYFLMYFLRKHTLYLFGIYRIVLGLLLIFIF
jgi:undecaprenyl-diphosphatase